ncbi:MAG: hypothetical protein QXZ44_05630 [Ferroplasma sp.]
MKYLIVDTNSFIYSIENKIDLYNEIIYFDNQLEPVLLDCVAAELKGLSNGNWKAKAAIQYATKFHKMESSGTGDNCIYNMAKKHGAAVLTNDRGLIKRLKDAGLTVVIIYDRRALKYF